MKELLVSHIGAIDGVSPIILLKLCPIEFHYQLLENHELDDYINKILVEDLSVYDHIYITDLCPSMDLLSKIDKSCYKEKFRIFDHHVSRVEASQYDFVTINLKECGTSLFYQYLNTKYNFEENVKNYVGHVRDLDLWLWQEKQNILAKNLGDLFTIYGCEQYIDTIYQKLNSNIRVSLNTFEQKILQLEKERIERYIEKKEKMMITFQYENYHVGCVFSELYRSEMGNVLATKYPHLDFIVMINSSGGISLRTIKNDMDVSLIAKKFGGGGHKAASGFSFSDEMRSFIIQNIFKGAILDENN